MNECHVGCHKEMILLGREREIYHGKSLNGANKRGCVSVGIFES
jgi:hypothetical protein